MKWPWTKEREDLEAHARRVADREAWVNRVYKEGLSQTQQNNIGGLLGALFVSPPTKDSKHGHHI